MMVKFHSEEYCDENFYLSEEEYYYLSEEDAMRNYKEPVYEYLHADLCGRVAEISQDSLYSQDEFIEQVLTKEHDPEYFI